MEALDYLVIAPHPDDAELGLGGTMLLLKAQGAKVGILDLTSGEPTPFGSPEIRKRETDEASKILNLEWRGNLGLANRSLQADVEARHRLAGVIRQLRPRYLFAPYWDDAHPDHVAASALVDAARFWAKLTKTDLPGEPHYPQKIIYYLSVHLRLHAKPSFVVDITAHLETKMSCLACYHSQFIAGRSAGVRREHLKPSTHLRCAGGAGVRVPRLGHQRFVDLFHSGPGIDQPTLPLRAPPVR